MAMIGARSLADGRFTRHCVTQGEREARARHRMQQRRANAEAVGPGIPCAERSGRRHRPRARTHSKRKRAWDYIPDPRTLND